MANIAVLAIVFTIVGYGLYIICGKRLSKLCGGGDSGDDYEEDEGQRTKIRHEGGL